MQNLAKNFNDLLRFQGHTEFPGYQDYLKDKTRSPAQKEFDLGQEPVKLVPRDQRRLA